jgi:hypothetical protein
VTKGIFAKLSEVNPKALKQANIVKKDAKLLKLGFINKKEYAEATKKGKKLKAEASKLWKREKII